MRKLLVILFVLCAAPVMSANVYYVNLTDTFPGGDTMEVAGVDVYFPVVGPGADANPGTDPAAPKESFASAATAVNNGDTILVFKPYDGDTAFTYTPNQMTDSVAIFSNFAKITGTNPFQQDGSKCIVKGLRFFNCNADAFAYQKQGLVFEGCHFDNFSAGAGWHIASTFNNDLKRFNDNYISGQTGSSYMAGIFTSAGSAEMNNNVWYDWSTTNTARIFRTANNTTDIEGNIFTFLEDNESHTVFYDLLDETRTDNVYWRCGDYGNTESDSTFENPELFVTSTGSTTPFNTNYPDTTGFTKGLDGGAVYWMKYYPYTDTEVFEILATDKFTEAESAAVLAFRGIEPTAPPVPPFSFRIIQQGLFSRSQQFLKLEEAYTIYPDNAHDQNMHRLYLQINNIKLNEPDHTLNQRMKIIETGAVDTTPGGYGDGEYGEGPYGG